LFQYLSRRDDLLVQLGVPRPIIVSSTEVYASASRLTSAVVQLYSEDEEAMKDGRMRRKQLNKGYLNLPASRGCIV